MAAYGPSSLAYQIQGLQTKNIPQKCRETEDILKRTSTKELRLVFPAILQSIFGGEGEPGWGIDRLCRSQHAHDFETIRAFLAPEGPLLNAVHSLQVDPCSIYQFNFQNLPFPSQHAIEEGVVPFFYVNKLQNHGYPHVPTVSLNAFEMYMFHFAYALVSPAWQQGGTSWSARMFDWLYPSLVDDYLNYFLPLDRNELPTLSTGSPVRSQFAQSPFSVHHQRPMVTAPQRQQRYSLFNPAILMQQKQHAHNSAVLDNTEAETWRSETMLRTFVEFWLNQNSLVADIPSFSPGSSHSPLSYGQMYSPFNYLFEHFMPSLNQVLVVRMVVKYLHYFSNTATNVITSPYQHRVELPLDHFKRTVIPQIVQKKLYWFLRHAFDNWPLDCYFRMVLETWLSYIQPWRYTDTRHYRHGKEPRSQHLEPRDRRVEDKWDQFVEDSLLFYTVLFRCLLPRLERMDFTSPTSAYMLFRVTKVFNSPNLASLIANAEQEICGMPVPLSRTADLGGSYLSASRLQPAVPNLSPHLTDMEVPGFQYIPLFSDHMQRMMNNLMRKVVQAHAIVTIPHPQPPASTGRFSWLWSLLGDNGASGKSDTHRTAVHLKETVKNIAEIFSLQAPTWPEETAHSKDKDSLGDSTMMEEDDVIPDCVETAEGPKLTSKGRSQIINKMRRFENWQAGDPDLQPIRSFENATLVRFLFHICSILNSQFSNQIWQLYQRQDFVGRLAKVYLAPPLSSSQRIQSPISHQTAERLRQPRISLRMLASYQTLSVLVLLYVVLYLWLGTGPVTYVLLLGSGVVLYGVFCALFMSAEVS